MGGSKGSEAAVWAGTGPTGGVAANWPRFYAASLQRGAGAPLRCLCGSAGTAWWKNDLESSGVEK